MGIVRGRHEKILSISLFEEVKSGFFRRSNFKLFLIE